MEAIENGNGCGDEALPGREDAGTQAVGAERAEGERRRRVIRKCAAVRRLEGTPEDERLFCELILQPHVFWNVAECFRDPVGLHEFLKDLEEVYWVVFGAFDSDGKFLGSAWVNLDDEGTLFIHCAFHEGADVLSCAIAIDEHIKRNYPPVKRLEGDIPDKCWGAQILAKHLGFRDLGIIEGIKCLRGNPLEYCEVRKFVKEG